MSITFYRGFKRSNFTTTAEPTIEGQAGTDSLSQSVAAGGQVPDLMDGNRHTLFTASFDTTVVTNGTFDADSDWGKTNEWSIGSGTASVTGGAGSSDLTQSALIVGVKYAVTYDISTYVSGNVTVKLGTVSGTARSSSGTFTESLTCAGNTTLTFSTSSAADLSIDNVVIKPLDLRFDMSANERVDASCLILDNMDMWDNLPSAARSTADLYYHSADSFSAATFLPPAKTYGGLLGSARPYLDFDGSNDVVNNDTAPVYGYPFSIECWLRTTATATGTVVYIGDASADNVYYEFEVTTAGLPNLIARNPASRQAIGTVPVNDGEWHHMVGLYTGDTDRTLYIDGVSVATNSGTATFNTAVDRITLGVVNRPSPAQYFDGDIRMARVWNRELTSAEITSLYNGGLVPMADQWGDNTNLLTNNSFTTDLTDWSDIGNHTLTRETGIYRSSPASGKIVSSGGGDESGHKVSITESITRTTGNTYRIIIHARTASGTETLNLARFADTGTEKQWTVTSSWTRFTYDATVVDGVNYPVLFLSDAGTVYIDDIEIIRTGCVVEYAPDGISQAGGKWYDSSSISLDGTITGADYKLTPNGSTRGFLLQEFAEANARYWFVNINGDSLTASGNPIFGQLILGEKFTPAASPDLNQTFGSGIGAAGRTAYGGNKYVNKRHDSRYTRTMAWSFLSAADKNGFLRLFEDIEVSEDGPSLYPLYYADQTKASDDPILRCARVIGKPEFVETAYQAYSLSLVLEDEV